MANESDKIPGMEDFQKTSAEFMKILAKNQDVMSKFMKAPQEAVQSMLDPFNVMQSFTEGAKQLASNPEKLMQANMELWQQHMQLWQHAADRLMGKETKPVAESDKGDRRFKSKEWEENQVFDVIRQSYLITSRWLTKTMANIDNLSEDDARKVQFHTQQMADALSPSNFLLTNPEVIKATVESGGQNLVRGMENLKRDIEAGKGQLKIRMADDRGLRTRQEHRHSAGQGRLPERCHAAHPVRTDDSDGVPAAAADLAAVDQQVLHSRPAARQFLHPLRRRPRLYRVRRFVGKSGRRAGREVDGRLPARRTAAAA